MTHLIDHLEKGVNWSNVFGMIDSLYNDEGYSSNADNFSRASNVEKGIAKLTDLVRVDKTGYDFIYDQGEDLIKIEMKMGKNLFYKRTPYNTKKFKVKSFLSEKKTVEDFRQSKTFDYMLVLDITARRVLIVEDEIARSLYQEGADGAMIELKPGNYYECEIGEVTPNNNPVSLTEEVNKVTDKWFTYWQ